MSLGIRNYKGSKLFKMKKSEKENKIEIFKNIFYINN